MFVEIFTGPRAEFELIEAETEVFTRPPDGLVSAVAWQADNPDEVTSLFVWDTPDARGDFAFHKVMPLADAGKVVTHGRRLKPIKVFVRG